MRIYVYANHYFKHDADAVLLVSHKQFDSILKNGWPKDAEILLAFPPEIETKKSQESTMGIYFKETFPSDG